MHIKEKAKDDRCAAVERGLFNLLLEVERHFRAEERKDLDSKRGRSHRNFLRIMKEPSDDHAT